MEKGKFHTKAFVGCDGNSPSGNFWCVLVQIRAEVFAATERAGIIALT